MGMFYKKYFISFAILLFSLLLSACTAKKTDYYGTWIGLDDTTNPRNYTIYEFEIGDAGNDQLTVKITRKGYELDPSETQASWVEGQGVYVYGTYNKDGSVSTSLFKLEYNIGDNTIRFGNLSFTRKAKNSEVKLRQLAQNQLQKSYNGVTILN